MSLSRDAFRMRHRLRVRWAEVDLQKIVFNGHYLMYLDTAMADYWRALALPYEATMHALGGDLFVKKSSLEYHASAYYDDQLEVGLRCERVGNSSMLFMGGVFRGAKLLVHGELVYVYANPATMTSQPVPESLRQILLGFEQGQPMTEAQVGDWPALREAAMAVRTAVFVQEQGIPLEHEMDALDADATHVVLRNRYAVPIGTARLLQPSPGVGQIGRMAVVRLMRGSHFGAELVQTLLDVARQRGDREVILHAQCTVQGFYERLGFQAEGAVFEEEGIDHIAMRRSL